MFLSSDTKSYPRCSADPSIQPCLISPPNHSPLLPSADSCISATAIRLHCHAKYRLSAMSRGDGGVSDARNCKQSEYRHFLCAHNSEGRLRGQSKATAKDAERSRRPATRHPALSRARRRSRSFPASHRRGRVAASFGNSSSASSPDLPGRRTALCILWDATRRGATRTGSTRPIASNPARRADRSTRGCGRLLRVDAARAQSASRPRA